MGHLRPAAILALCAALTAPWPAGALEADRAASPPAAAARAAEPSPLAVLMWRWNVHRLLAGTTPVPLRVPEPGAGEVRITSRIEPQVRARLAALGGRPPSAERQAGAADRVRTAKVEAPAPMVRDRGRTPRLDLPPFLAAASVSAPAPAPALPGPPPAAAETSGLLYAAAALAHGRIETGDDTWKLGLSVSRDLDEFRIRLGYAFPAR